MGFMLFWHGAFADTRALVYPGKICKAETSVGFFLKTPAPLHAN